MSAPLPEPAAAVCPQCGGAVPPGSPGGHCPRCLAQTGFLTEDAEEPDAPVLLEAQPWAVLGDCELLEEIGRGGMGVVYRARQRKLGRLLAVKVLRGGEFAGAEARQRFKAEAENAARLRHPGIVTVHDFGEEQGVCWISMELIAGQNLDDLTRHQPMPAMDAARCVQSIAAAVRHAHEQGVLHRDLKPSNILLNAEGQPHIADFGIARRMEAGAESITRTGQMLGSPGFTAPEQALRGAADARTDVYGLGAILYSILTSRPPFQGPTPDAILMQLRDGEPVPPRRLIPTVPRDLETVCLKCLHREPARRYTTARELEEDLRRFLHGEPVLARPRSLAEKSGRWLRRHWPLAAAGLISLTALIAGSIISLVLAAQAREAAAQSRASEAAARRLVYARDMQRAQQLLLEGRRGGLDVLAAHAPGAADHTDLRGWEWYFLQTAAASSQVVASAGGAIAESAIALSPDGRQFAGGLHSGGIAIRETATGNLVREIPAGQPAVTLVQWLADGRRIASCNYDGDVSLHDAVSGRVLAEWPAIHKTVLWLNFSADGKFFAHAGGDGLVFLRDEAGKIVQTIRTARVALLTWHPRRPLLALTGPFRDEVSLCGPEAAEVLQSFPAREVTAAAWQPDSAALALASGAGTVRLIDTASNGREIWSHSIPAGRVRDLKFTPAGDRLVLACENGPVRILRAEDGAEDGTVMVHDEGATVLDVTDAAGVSVGPVDGVRTWRLHAPAFAATALTAPAAVKSLTWSADGHFLHAVCLDGQTWQCPVWDRRQSKWLPATPATGPGPGMGAWSQDGQQLARIVTLGALRALAITRFPAGDITSSIPLQGGLSDLRWSPDATRIALSLPTAPRQTLVHDLTLNRSWSLSACTLFAYSPQVMTATNWSTDSRQLLICDRAWLYEADGHVPGTWPAYDDRGPAGQSVLAVTATAWQPQGAVVACGGQSGRLEIRAAGDGRILRSVNAHRTTIRTLAWNPSGTRLATADLEGTVKLFDPDTLEELLTFANNQHDVRALAWSADGRILASGAADGSILLREAGP